MTMRRPAAASRRAAATMRRSAPAPPRRSITIAPPRVPAVERNKQQLPFDDDSEVLEHDRQDQRVPRRLMLYRDDRGAGRHVLEAADLAVEPDNRLEERKDRTRPEAAKPHDMAAR